MIVVHSTAGIRLGIEETLPGAVLRAVYAQHGEADSRLQASVESMFECIVEKRVN